MVDAKLHHPPLAAEALQRLGVLLDRLDVRLGDQPYLLGKGYSLADLIVASVVTYSTYCGVSLGGRPRINDWLHKFYARESYKKTWGEAPAQV